MKKVILNRKKSFSSLVATNQYLESMLPKNFGVMVYVDDKTLSFSDNLGRKWIEPVNSLGKPFKISIESVWNTNRHEYIVPRRLPRILRKLWLKCQNGTIKTKEYPFASGDLPNEWEETDTE